MVHIDDEIKMVSIRDIIPYENNPKKHDKEQIRKLAEHIKEVGWDQPIVVDEHSVILKGHGRLLAAKRLRLKEVPVIFKAGLTAAQAKAVRIADNQLAEIAEWNYENLRGELLGLEKEEVSLEGLGYTENVLEEILGREVSFRAESKEGFIEDDEVPETQKNQYEVKPGDIWSLGKHRLMCGDSTSEDNVAKLMDGQNADLLFTDPPYNVNYGASKHQAWGKKRNNEEECAIKNDHMDRKEFRIFCLAWAKVIEKFCDGCIYVWGAPGADGRVMFTVLDEIFHDSTTIIWNKDRMTLGRGKYQNKYEPCWFGWNKSGKNFDNSDRTLTNIWDFSRPSVSDLHPTMKPIGLCEIGISHGSKPDQVVLDLFLGSGSTLIACEKIGRTCYGMELDEHYCSVIINRWQEFTGEKAIRINR